MISKWKLGIIFTKQQSFTIASTLLHNLIPLLIFRLELDRIYVCVINATWLAMLQWCVNKSRVLWSDLGGQHRITFHSKCNVAAICYLVHLCKEDVCFFAVSSNNIIMSKTIHTRRYISVKPSMVFVRMVVYQLSIFSNSCWLSSILQEIIYAIRRRLPLFIIGF